MNWLLARPIAPALLVAAAAGALLNAMLLVPALYTLQVFDRVLASRSGETLLMLSALVLVALGLACTMDQLRTRALDLAAATLGRVLSPLALRHMLRRQARQRPGEAGDALRDLGSLRGFLGGGGVVALFDAPWLPVYLGVITLLHPLLGALAGAGALALLTLGVLTELGTRRGHEQAQQRARSSQRAAQALLRRAETVIAMGIDGPAVAAWADRQSQALDEQSALALRGARLAAAARTLNHGLQAAMLGLGAWLVIAEQASPGIMVAASLLTGRALQPATQLIGGWKQLVQARAAWRRLAEADSTAAETETLALPAPAGRIDVERLIFGGGAQQTPLLRGVDLRLAAGQSLGLLGASGAGKSTLLRLLLGLWAPQGGVVRLDGADIARWDRDRLAPFVGYLPQEVELFPGTVAENIARLGPVDAACVTAAAQLAQAHELILRLPKGYDTLVGEGAAALSGGQRQRIALARALYGEPRLVVLDEPNAHLDAEGEAALAAALRALKARGTTVIVATHRNALLSQLDRIAVLKDGVLQAVDTHPTIHAVPPLRAAAAA